MCRKAWCPSGHHCPEGLTCMLVFAIFSAVLGMFQFGYNTGVINAPQKILENFIADVYKTRTGRYMSEQMLALIWSLTVSIFAVGGMVGGISGGAIADYCGRKCGLLLNNAIAILGATLMSSSHLFRSIECLIMGRFAIGLSCGLNTALVPMYLSEIAPMTLRGALGTVSQLGVTIGLLLSQILGLPLILGTDEGWPFLLGVAFIPAVLQLMLLPMCPESPRYLLISKGRLTDATYALQRLRCTSNVEDDIEEMRIEDRAQQQEARITMCQLFSNKSLQMPLIIGIVMQLSQQLSGINAIFYYSTGIFTSAGLKEEVAKYSTIGVGVVMVAMTLITIMLMDRTGRRTLHLYGLGGMFITSMFLTIFLLFGFLYYWMSYMSVISTLIYVVFFAIGPGSIPWMITAELFSQGPRPAAMSVAVLVNWFTNFVVGLCFPLMTTFNDNAMEKYAFLPFTVFLAVFWTFTYFKVPETKNRTFEEIAALFRKDDLIPIDDVQYSHSHKSSSADIYSHKSSSGDIIFNDERTLEKCYLHHHHHVQHHCHFDQPPPPQIAPPGSTHPSPGHPLHQQPVPLLPPPPQAQPPPNSGPLPPLTPQSGGIPVGGGGGGMYQSDHQLPHPLHPSHPHIHPMSGIGGGPGPPSGMNHHQASVTPTSGLNHHHAHSHPKFDAYFTGLPPPLQPQSQSQTALNSTTPTSVTPPSSVTFGGTLGRKKMVTMSSVASTNDHHHHPQFTTTTANFTPNHRIIIEDQL